MPLLHCFKCRHEWESTNPLSTCEWCGGKGLILEEKTPHEKFADKLCENQQDLEPEIAEMVDKNFWELF